MSDPITEEIKLTCEAKDAIRSFLWRYLIPPAAVLTILAGVVGYFLRGVAQNTAYHEAFLKASDQMLLISENAGKATVQLDEAGIVMERNKKTVADFYTQADAHRKQTNDALIDSQKVLREADALREKLKTLEAFQRSGQDIEAIVAALSKPGPFLGGLTSQLTTLQAPVGAILPFIGNPKDLPKGWALCDGSVVTLAGSPLIGQKLPDFQGRFPRGALAGVTVPADLTTGGQREMALQVANLPPHSHELPYKLQRDEIEHHSNYNREFVGTGGSPRQTKETGQTGSGAPFNIEPPFQDVFFIVKLQ